MYHWSKSLQSMSTFHLTIIQRSFICRVLPGHCCVFFFRQKGLLKLNWHKSIYIASLHSRFVLACESLSKVTSNWMPLAKRIPQRVVVLSFDDDNNDFFDDSYI